MTQIAVNHLTRMREGERICVAGIELQSKTHLRPVTDIDRPLTRSLLAERGGPFELGAVVDLGEVEARPDPPHVEDHLFQPDDVKPVAQLDGDEYLQLIEEVCCDDIEEAFGPALHRPGKWRYAVGVGQGSCSLACVRLSRVPDIEVDRYGKPTVRFNDPEKPAYVRVTDIRLFESDHQTLRPRVIEDLRRRFRRGVGVWLAFGLSRPFQVDGETGNWLQVNGICLEDSPLGVAP